MRVKSENEEYLNALYLSEDWEEEEEEEEEDEVEGDIFEDNLPLGVIKEEDEEPEEQEEAVEDEESEEEEPEEQEEEGEEEEDEVSLGDEVLTEPEPDPQETPLIKQMRRQLKEQTKQLKELKSKAVEPAPTQEYIKEKPTLEGEDFDAEAYEKKLDLWYTQQAEAEKYQRSIQKQRQAYNEGKANLKVKDFNEAEAVVVESFNVAQQELILDTAQNSSLLVYALGKAPAKAEELAKITNPAKLAYELGKLEGQLKVNKKRKAAVKPEKRVSTNARSSSALQTGLERERAKAEKTGNYTSLIQYKRKHNLK